MIKRLAIVTVILALMLFVDLPLGGCTPTDTSRLQVVTSTSHLEQLVKRVGGDLVDVINIVPPASHPGDFDTSPGDMQKLADADLFLWHNWPGEVYVEGLIESADNPDLTVKTVEIEGSWMTPPVILLAVDKVVEALSGVDSENRAAYKEAGEAYKGVIKAKEAEIRTMLTGTGISEAKVLCAGWQAGFLSWAGFNIVATYGLPTAPTISDIEELVELGREVGVNLVIDNLHDNPDAGKPIATELGCKRIILLNFPGVNEDTKTWEETLDYNIALILEALAD